MTTQVLRQVIPKEILQVMEKAEGGLEQIVKDYSGYLKDAQQQQKMQKEQEKPQETFEQPQQQSASPQVQMQQEAQSMQQQKAPISQTPQARQEQPIEPEELNTQAQPIAPVEQPQINKGELPSKPLALMKNGKVGEIEGIKNGVATINVDGKQHKEKASSITEEPADIETAVRQLVDVHPEGMKSTALQSMVHIPSDNMLMVQFYDGKWAWYRDVPEDVYKEIAIGTYEPKGQEITGIAEYKPGVADSRGAGFPQ